MKRAFPLVLKRILLPAVLSLVVYIALHEFGHAIVLWSVDAEITEFSILRAHVLYDGGNWTDLSDRWMHLNGALFPTVLAFLHALCYQRHWKNRVYRSFSFFFLVGDLFSLITWAVNPLLYLPQIESSHAAGMVLQNDDTYKFLYNFSFDYPVWIVSVVTAAVLALGVFLLVKKGILGNFAETVREIRSSANPN